MQGTRYTVTFHIPGTLAANITPCFTVPFNCSLLHVSATATNNSDATLKIGTTSDDDAYLVAAAIGDSSVPVEFVTANFVNTEDPHIVDGTVMLLTLDFDGAGGTAAQNVTIVLTFSEG